MAIAKGSRVKLHPSRADGMPPPFCHYAAQGRVGVVVEQTKDGDWRVSFDPSTPHARPQVMVARARELLPA